MLFLRQAAGVYPPEPPPFPRMGQGVGFGLNYYITKRRYFTMKRPLAYITAAWCGSDHENTKLAAQYCRTVYEAGFSPTPPGQSDYEGTIYQYNYDNVISCVCIASCCAGVFIYLHLGTICPKVASPGCRSPPFLRFVHPPTHELNGGSTNDDHQSEGLLRLVHP